LVQGEVLTKSSSAARENFFARMGRLAVPGVGAMVGLVSSSSGSILVLLLFVAMSSGGEIVGKEGVGGFCAEFCPAVVDVGALLLACSCCSMAGWHEFEAGTYNVMV
jgi:hypothetical protein